MENTAIALPLALALELSPGTTSTALTLNRDQSAELAALIATDLYQLLPTANKARLSVVGALFDMVELLRPGFMVWDALSELARRVPRGRLENVVAFGHHEGRMPMPVLEPDARHANGAMRLLPLSLLAPVACAPTLGSQLEATLMAQGQAGTRSADFLMRSLGLRLEHARYLTRNDLLALGCVQYEHANLAGLWQLLETALLTPSSEESTLSARGMRFCYRDGVVQAQSPAQSLLTERADSAHRSHLFASRVFELRLYAALLKAHHIALHFQDVSGDASAGYLLEPMAKIDPDAGPPALYAHEARGLGVVTLSLAQRSQSGGSRVLMHAYPLHAASLAVLAETLAKRYGTREKPHALGCVSLDKDGRLGVPGELLPG